MERNNKTIFVSGGTSGIGFAIVEKYLKEGYFVIINYNKGGMSVNVVKEKLHMSGYLEKIDYLLFSADVSNENNLCDSLNTLSFDLIRTVTILINNAGILHRSNICELTQQDWINVFNVNVFGYSFLAKWFFKQAPNLNNIINIGSIRGESAITRINNAAYSISKSTIPALTALQAKTFGPKVRVNAILPGTINTPQRQGISNDEIKLYGEKNSIIPRLGKPEEIAEMCFFITSSKVEYMTGTSIILDGGYSINYIR